jgi:hypothetical protein
MKAKVKTEGEMLKSLSDSMKPSVFSISLFSQFSDIVAHEAIDYCIKLTLIPSPVYSVSSCTYCTYVTGAAS